MKLKVSEIASSDGEPHLEPEDNVILFKHCSGGAVAIEFSKILPIVELIKMHGEEVELPHIQPPRAKFLIRKSDGAKFYLVGDLYYREDYREDRFGIDPRKFSIFYFDVEGEIYD